MTEHAVAFFIFNRPDVTALSFERIRQAQPKKLFLIADGPRSSVPQDQDLCKRTRAIVSQVDWNCEIIRDFSEVNMGCRHRVSSGLDFVFSQVEEAIILEDDCLAEPSFFQFCDVLLEQYKDNHHVFSISGTTFQPEQRADMNSYYFSRYPHIWGWASWRRVWNSYDVEIKDWEKIRNNGGLKEFISDYQVRLYWHNKFQKIFDQKIDTWDFQFIFTSFCGQGLHIIPNQNLVSNIGFGLDATHTKKENKLTRRKTSQMNFPLISPEYTTRDVNADKITEAYLYECQIHRRLLNRIKSFIYI